MYFRQYNFILKFSWLIIKEIPMSLNTELNFDMDFASILSRGKVYHRDYRYKNLLYSSVAVKKNYLNLWAMKVSRQFAAMCCPLDGDTV
jgi:hypothetical protein